MNKFFDSVSKQLENPNWYCPEERCEVSSCSKQKISREREGIREENEEEKRKPKEMTLVASFFKSE